MQIEALTMDKIMLDPANVRKHGKKSIDAIKASLARFGQQKPIVVDSNGVIRAGNGTFMAAKELGWQNLNCVRSELTGAELSAFGIADNRTAELSEWSEEVKDLIGSLKLELPDLDTFNLGLDDLLADLPAPVDTSEQAIDARFDVLVQCADEHGQAALLEKLMKEGYTCKALIS